MSHTANGTTDDDSTTDKFHTRETGFDSLTDTGQAVETAVATLHEHTGQEVLYGGELATWTYEPVATDSKAAERTGLVGMLHHESGAELPLYTQDDGEFGFEVYDRDGNMLTGQNLIPVKRLVSVVRPVMQVVEQSE